MDLGSPFAVLPVCAMLICLLGAARSDKECPCPEIPKRNDTQPPAKNCFKINDIFRYKCKEPNLRKAGTSNFIKCKEIDNVKQWTPSPVSLECIPDPTRPIQQAPSSTVTTDPNTTKTRPPSSTVATAPSGPQMTESLSTSASVSAEPDRAGPTSPGLQAPSGRSQDKECPCPEIPKRIDTQPPAKNCFKINDIFRYKCKEPNLRKAGTSNFIKCKEIDNVKQWIPSPVSLECIPDPTRTIQQAPSSTVTTAPSGPQMTESLSTSASVSAERDRAGPTSPGLQAPSGRSQAGKKGAVTESETSQPTTATLTAASTAVIGCLSVAIVCALIGISFFCYKRRSRSNIPQLTPEETMPMNNVSSEH